jgi:fucose permease
MTKSNTLLVSLAFAIFIVVGLNAGLLGVAWPSIRDTYAVGDDAFGPFTLIAMLGSLIVTFASGRLIERFGTGALLAAGCLGAAIGRLSTVLAPSWWTLVAANLIATLGISALSPAINLYFAAHESRGRMNWLHASFGLGATIGPALMAWILAASHSWRWGYATVILAFAALALILTLTLDRWPRLIADKQPPDPRPSRPARGQATLALPAVWLSVALFFIFTGMEATSGQWTYTLFTEGRGVPTAAAGMWVSAYWACMTVGRIGFGIIADHVPPTTLVPLCMTGIICGAALIWASALPWLGLLGLSIVGLGLAPLFPVLTSTTPDRLGRQHAANAVGYQITGVKLGLAAFPALAGALTERVGIHAVGPFLLSIAVATLALYGIMARTAAAHDRRHRS